MKYKKQLFKNDIENIGQSYSDWISKEKQYKKQLFDKLIESLTQSSSDWVFDGYAIKNTTTGFRIWAEHGWLSYSLCRPFEINFTLSQRWKLKKAISICKSKHILNLMK